MSDDGGPAFPNPGFDNGPGNFRGRPAEGMTLRDYFAAKAMQAILPTIVLGTAAEKRSRENDEAIGPIVANGAYAVADAMLKVREQ